MEKSGFITVPDFRRFSLLRELLCFAELPRGFKVYIIIRSQDVSIRVSERSVDSIGTCAMCQIRCSDMHIENRVKWKLIATGDGPCCGFIDGIVIKYP